MKKCSMQSLHDIFKACAANTLMFKDSQWSFRAVWRFTLNKKLNGVFYYHLQFLQYMLRIGACKFTTRSLMTDFSSNFPSFWWTLSSHEVIVIVSVHTHFQPFPLCSAVPPVFPDFFLIYPLLSLSACCSLLQTT